MKIGNEFLDWKY